MDAPTQRRRRKPKAPLPLWIVENREAQPSDDGKGWTSDELALRLGVAPSTVRGWETGRSISDDNIRAMERLFGKQAPGRDEPEPSLAAALSEFAVELRASREGRERTEARLRALEAEMESLRAQRGGAGSPTRPVPQGSMG